MAEPSRRLTAILFSDIAGYTAQMGADEARAIRAVERSREIQRGLVERFHGQWVQEIGDGALATFGSCVDAVMCGLEIQRALGADPDLQIRIGIHEGDIVFQGTDIFGDGVNVAARLQAAARPGGICVSERVYDELRNKQGIQAKFLGEKEFKNVNRRIRVYALSQTESAATGATGNAPLQRASRRRSWFRVRPILALGFVVCAVLGYLLYVRNREAILATIILNYPRVFGAPIEQKVGFANAKDGVRIAYATAGHGPAVINVLGWFTHLERGINSPAFSDAPRWKDRYFYVRYDGRGTGLSDRGIKDFSLDAKVGDLDAVVDALGLDQFALYIHSAGGPTAIAYIARHPERVTRAVFYGSFARLADTPEQENLLRSMAAVMRTGWGSDTPAFRQLFTSLFMPNADSVGMRLFNDFQRIAATPEDAANFMESIEKVDVRDLATQLRLPVLVIHVRGDLIVPYRFGRELASLIPGARLLTIEGEDHAMLPDSPGGHQLVEAAEAFLSGAPAPQAGS